MENLSLLQQKIYRMGKALWVLRYHHKLCVYRTCMCNTYIRTYILTHIHTQSQCDRTKFSKSIYKPLKFSTYKRPTLDIFRMLASRVVGGYGWEQKIVAVRSSGSLLESILYRHFVEKTKVTHYTPRLRHCLVRGRMFSPVSQYLTRPLGRPICLSIYF